MNCLSIHILNVKCNSCNTWDRKGKYCNLGGTGLCIPDGGGGMKEMTGICISNSAHNIMYSKGSLRFAAERSESG